MKAFRRRIVIMPMMATIPIPRITKGYESAIAERKCLDGCDET
ncbi:MAG TPA: hypothetical protein VMW24_11800 [Sedimentisphaerales bacterium]|nr:hypothetical protein [Sedimentisphaerales bacterium]